MAWGFFNKLKNGLIKVGRGIASGAKFLNDKVIKPIVKPLMPAVSQMLDQYKPGFGTAVSTGVNFGSSFIDSIPLKRRE
jgi:hypothetical protein